MPGKLEDLMKDINKSYGEEVFITGGSFPEIKRIPFSSIRANYMTYGGVPRGRIIEFAGEESGGKTSTAIDICINAQKLFQEEYEEEVTRLTSIDKPSKLQQQKLLLLQERGPQHIVYADLENTFDVDWAQLLGLDTDSIDFYKAQGQSAEEIFEDMIKSIETEEVGLVVMDSLGVMVSAQAYEKSIEQKTYGGISMALTLFSKKANAVCLKHNCTLIGINQIRDNMSSPYGGVTTPGGKAWKHNASVRIMFRKGDFVDEFGDPIKRSSEAPAGNRVQMDIVKTKAFKPNRRLGYYTLSYSTGIDTVGDMFDLALANNLIIKGGSWFNFNNPETMDLLCDEDGSIVKAQGRANAVRYLAQNDNYRNLVESYLNKIVSSD